MPLEGDFHFTFVCYIYRYINNRKCECDGVGSIYQFLSMNVKGFYLLLYSKST